MTKPETNASLSTPLHKVQFMNLKVNWNIDRMKAYQLL